MLFRQQYGKAKGINELIAAPSDFHTGGALLFNERGPDGGFMRQIIVKYFDPGNDSGEPISELQILDALRGAERLFTFRSSGSESLGNALILEYIGHGTLHASILRFLEKRRRIPERLIWGVFLCLTRACVAMRYPAGLPQGALLYRELMPAPGQTGPINIQHNDMHLENILIGDTNMYDMEHRFSPQTKLIDFGYARTHAVIPALENLQLAGPGMAPGGQNNPAEDTPSSQKNIYDVATNIQDLATMLRVVHTYSQLVTVNTGPNNSAVIMTDAGVTVLQAAPITDTLRHLLFRCLAKNAADRPPLREVVQICERQVYYMNEWSYRNLPAEAWVYETDHAIWDALNDIVLNADYYEEYQRLAFGRRRSAAGLEGVEKGRHVPEMGDPRDDQPRNLSARF
ncbi:hypothetical protein DL765_010064 [Monosporascus sp. GIB2]|nr:hypothetical protein DL765_010064 [Monosporascus sp. GIB2]